MKRILFVTLFIIITSTLALSQSQTPTATPPAYQVSVVKIKNGMGQEYQDFHKSERIPALKKGGVKEEGIWRTAQFGQPGEYIIARRVENLAQFDDPSPINKALGAEAARAHNAKLASFIENARNYLISLRPELSITPKAGTALKLASHTTTRIAPGRRTEYENYIKNDLLPLLKKAEVKGFLFYRVTMGGDANEYHSLILADSFADMQKTNWAISQAGYGNIEPKTAGIVTYREITMIRYVPELSIAPAPQTAEKK